MIRRLPPLAAIALLALLAACAPAALGSRNAPYDLARQRTTSANPGATIFAEATYALTDFRLAQEAFDDRVAIPLGRDGRAVRVTRDFELVDAIAPDGWALSIDAVWAESFGAAAPVLVATFRLDVPQGARLGGERLRVSLRSIATGAVRPIEWVVQVTPR